MRERCPDSRFIKAVCLNNAEFRYDGHSRNWDNKAVANIVNANGGNVWGGLFEVNENDLAQLDWHEGFPKSYGKKIVQVNDAEGKVYDAWVYFRIGEVKGRPSKNYRGTILEGAEDCNLPDEKYNKLIVFYKWGHKWGHWGRVLTLEVKASPQNDGFVIFTFISGKQ